MRRRSLSYLLFFIIILFLGMQLFLPKMAENRIAAGLINNTSEIEKLDVRVISFPPWEILSGKLDRIQVDAKGISSEGLYIKSLYARFHDILMKKEGIEGENTDLNIIITEDGLNKYLDFKYPSLKNFNLILNADKVYMKGYINFFDARIDIQLTGKFIVSEVNKVNFVTEYFKLEDINISATIINSLIKDMDFSFDFNTINIPIQIEAIKLINGEIQILGGISIEKAGL
jgi:hypothetical protein